MALVPCRNRDQRAMQIGGTSGLEGPSSTLQGLPLSNVVHKGHTLAPSTWFREKNVSRRHMVLRALLVW